MRRITTSIVKEMQQQNSKEWKGSDDEIEGIEGDEDGVHVATRYLALCVCVYDSIVCQLCLP